MGDFLVLAPRFKFYSYITCHGRQNDHPSEAPPETPEGTQSCQHLAFSPVKPLLDF